MLRPRLLITIVAAAASIVALAGSAKAAASPRTHAFQTAQPTDLSAQRRKRAVRRVAPAPSHIACTEFGCGPVPSGCMPVQAFNWWGNPTGFDTVVCRPRR